MANRMTGPIDLKITELFKWTKIGAIKEISLMAKNILVFASGCFIQFINLQSGEENFQLLNSHKVNGDGVKCIRGHGTLYIFAYAENCQGSTIYVKSYPDFQIVAKFVGGSKEGYKCLAFSETSLLFSLGEMPRYTVTAWNWRSLEKFAESNNELTFEDQIITCSYGRPMYLAQLGVKSNKLCIWDVFTVCKRSIFTKHEVKIGKLEPAPFEDIVWSQDNPDLYIIDTKGSIYTVDRDFHLELVVNFSTNDNAITSICWYMHGLAVSGPNQEIRHYKKRGNAQSWSCDWSYKTEKKIHCLIGGKFDQCIGVTDISELIALGKVQKIVNIIERTSPNSAPKRDISGGKFVQCIGVTDISELIALGKVQKIVNIIERTSPNLAPKRDISGSTPESQKYIRKNHSNFKSIGLINPVGEYMVARCNENLLVVYELLTGKLVSTYTVEDAVVTCMVENPEFPCIACGCQDGTLQLMSFYNETNPLLLVKMPLTDIPIQTMRYFERGTFLVASNLDYGEFFILKGLPGSQLEVTIYLNLKQQFIDYLFVASQNMCRLFLLHILSDHNYAGHEVVRYCIVDNKVVNVKKYEFECCGMTLYRRLAPVRGPDRDRNFYMIPSNNKYYHKVEIKRGSSVITIKEATKTGHQVNRFFLYQTKYHTITWGYDGFIFVRSLDCEKEIGMSLMHHRYQQGVNAARVNPLGTIVVSLGNSGVLAAVNFAANAEDEDLKKHIADVKSCPKMAVMFKRPTLGFFVEERFTGKCYKEVQRLKTIEKEEEACRQEKRKIYKEYADIQAVLQGLVTENYLVPENKKLDLMEFYLDTNLYNKKQQENRDQCKREETYLRCLIEAQDKVSSFIIKNYWEPMGVQWSQILGIFSSVKATNYCLLPKNIKLGNRLTWIEEQRKVEQFLSCQDSFEPWVIVSQEKLLEVVARRPVVPKDDYSGVAAMRRLQQIEEAESNKTLETKIALAGAVSQILIEVSSQHYQQRQISSFYQCDLQQGIAQNEVIKLKQNYNKCFANTRAIKEREMYNIKERNARLRHIISEYNYFSEKKIYCEILDPQWDETENPETAILHVSDNEISVMPYISPSEQSILDAKYAEDERIRLLLLADDFRERALMAMMNGVLEIRWEDELKRDVPQPKCLLEKSAEEFNEDDLRAIMEYEEKVEQLITEREKYKSLLDVEFNKVSTTQRDSIKRFNHKLYECTKYKFYIDQSMNQENLQVNRHRVNQILRIDTFLQSDEILETIATYEMDVEDNLKLLNYVQEALVECRVNLDTMQSKEKYLDKVFRKELIDMSPVVQEQAYKLYKKRPKPTYRNISTASVLNELAKGVLSKKTSINMTQDSLDYMKALDTFDLYAGVPPTIDESTWALICRFRRLRIEFDIRLRANHVQILDGEATIATFQKRVATKREKIAMLKTELDETRARRLYLIHNKQVQIVLRRGLVEIPLTGDLFTDFIDAILVSKSEIENVNKLIVEAGELKLNTILKNLAFRRKIMAAEWDHMRLRMQINDLIEQKIDIDNVKFTKEMQVYLKNKSLGRKPDAESFELEIELLAAAYENRIKDRKDKYKRTKKQLVAYKKSNKLLDKAIQEVNIDVCHYKLQKDWDIELKEKNIVQARIHAMLKRNTMVQKIQENHNEILVLQTELELLRLKTFPTFKYKVLD